MPLLAVESFDQYATSNGTQPAVSQRWTLAGSASSRSLVAGRFGVGQAYETDNAVNANTYAYNIGTSYATVCMGFAYECNHLLNNLNSSAETPLDLVIFRDSANALQCSLSLDNSGQLFARRGATVLATGNLKKLVKSRVYHYIECKVLISDTVGTFEVWVDGTKVINATGLDTKTTANANVQYVVMAFGASSSGLQRIDDFYITDGTRLGDLRIANLLPTADTADKDFVPLSGTDNYAMVDEAISDLDTTYNQGSTVGDLDFYTVGNAPAAFDSIVAVETRMYAKKTDATARTMRSRLRSSSSLANGASFALVQSVYGFKYDLFETDPDTTAAWTASGVNAVEVGMEILT